MELPKPETSEPPAEHPERAETPSATPGEEFTDPSWDEPSKKKAKKGPVTGQKVSAEVLAKRREGRIRALANIQNKLDELGIRRVEGENGLSFSTVPQIPLINQKNYYTDYLKKDDQITLLRDTKEMLRRLVEKKKNKNLVKEGSTATTDVDIKDLVDADDDDDDDDDEEAAEKDETNLRTIVVHPGSKTIRVGLSTDIDPLEVPSVIAHKNVHQKSCQEKKPRRELNEDGDIVIPSAHFKQYREEVSSNFKERMRYYKRRIVPNSSETVHNFNRRQTPQALDEAVEGEYKDAKALLDDSNVRYLFGEEALSLTDYSSWQLKWPFLRGGFNTSEYLLAEELFGDVQIIMHEALNRLLESKRSEFSHFNCVLVIPDLYDKTYVENLIYILLNHLKFDHVAIIQEGVAATFGSGISSACVVDMGAKSVKVSCVDEGMVIPNSTTCLDYGGDDITEALANLLLESQFPYKDVDLSTVSDFSLMQGLKEKYLTCQDADIAVQLYSFTVNRAGESGAKYAFKVFDEVMIAAMGLFYPELLKEDDSVVKDGLFPDHCDYFTSKPDSPTSKVQEKQLKGILLSQLEDKEALEYLVEEGDASAKEISKTSLNLTPVDFAIIESISNASLNDEGKLKKFYENIILVGGTSKIPGLDLILLDRIHIWRSRLLGSTNLETIVKYLENEKQKFEDKIKEKEKNREEKAKLKGMDLSFKLTEQHLGKINDLIESGNPTNVEILSNSRNIDPSAMVWKGGSVYARLKVANEMWISHKDWDFFGNRALVYKCLFNY